MPRKQPAKRTPPPKAPKAGRENTLGGEQPKRHLGDDENIADRRARAFSLRRAGASYRAIAQQLSVSLATAYDDVNAELMELREQTKADAEAVREIELHRCDEMILGLWPAVRRGDPKAVSAAVRVSERRSKLLGLDAPSKSEISGANGGPVELLEVRESLARKLAGLAARLGSSGVAGEPYGR
jgi:hypothetical protein